MDDIRETFGDAFIEYCLNIPRGGMEANSISLSQRQRDVVNMMRQALHESQSAEGDDAQRRVLLSGILNYSPSHGMSTGNYWRQYCGGDFPATDCDDPVEKSLLTLGLTVFPSCIAQKPLSLWFLERANFASAANHPCNDEFAKAVLEDSTLAKLFPGASDQLTDNGDMTYVRSEVLWSDSTGGTLQLPLLASNLLRAAARKLDRTATPEYYFTELRRVLANARNLARKKLTQVSGIAGMAQVDVSPSSPISLSSGGVLRAPEAGDYPELAGAPQVTAVLEFSAPLQLLEVTASNEYTPSEAVFSRWKKFDPDFERHRERFRREVDLLRLTVLLGSPKDKYIAPPVITSTLINPLSSGVSAIEYPFRYPTSVFGESVITPEIAQAIEGWAPRVAAHPNSLDMGMRRLLSAVTLRLDPMDGFVDAVICWENLFGTGEGEVVFRVAGAISHLIEPQAPSARKELFDEVRRLYGIRSKLVHGAKEPSRTEAVTYMARAVEIAIQALKEVYRRPELLRAENSSVRNRLVLIGS